MGLSEESRPLSTPGLGRWLSSSTTPGSAEAPSSPRTTCSPPPTVPTAPATPLDARLACPLDLPGLSTTWTGSSRRLECLEPSSLFFSSRNNLKIKDLFYDPEIQCLVLSFKFVRKFVSGALFCHPTKK